MPADFEKEPHSSLSGEEQAIFDSFVENYGETPDPDSVADEIDTDRKRSLPPEEEWGVPPRS